MYTFKKECPPNEGKLLSRYCGTHVSDSLQTAHSKYLGQVITLFGQPDYTTEDNEDMFGCWVKAEDEQGNGGYLQIYYGPGGPAISAPENGELDAAVKELAELIFSAKPSDYAWEGIYGDIPAKVHMGVKNGIPYYECELPEDIEDFEDML